MSIPIKSDDTRFERFRWAIRLSPLAVAFILAALWIAESPDDVPDLRLSAPVVARPGSSIGVRAWHLDEDRDGFPIIRAPDVDVDVRDARGSVLSRVTLQPSRGQGVEGTIDISPNVSGRLLLEARATLEGKPVSVERTLHVVEGIDSKLPAWRPVNAFQMYELDPIRVRDSARGPATIDPRAEEGACVPDLPCTLVVWLDDWDGRVRLRGRAGLSGEPQVTHSSDGFARFTLVVRGQEGLAEVEAIGDDGAVLASRGVRLPLVPGGMVARASVEGKRVRLEWRMLAGTGPVLVDVYERRRWVRATSLAPEEPWLELPDVGVWRLQLRRDLYSDETAAVTYAVVSELGGSSVLRSAAEAVVADAEREGLDPLAMEVLDGSFAGGADDALRAMFAIPSFNVVTVGLGVSSSTGVAFADEGRDPHEDLRRWLAAGLIVFLGLIVSLFLLQVERVAQARARRLLEQLDADARAPPRRTAGRGLWAFVLFVFVMMAVLALSKRWF